MSYLNTLTNLRSRREMYATTIDDNVLISAIEHVRLGCTARNSQTLRYALINDPKQVRDIFEGTNLPTAHEVTDEQMPSAFIVIGQEKEILQNNLLGIDIGIAVQIIREYLLEEDLASVCIYSFNRNATKQIIGNELFNPECLISIGKSCQIVHLEDSDENVANYRNDNNEHTTRKLNVDTLVINRKEVK